MSGRQAAGRQSAFQDIQQRLKVVDLILEVCDARIPYASRHPKFDKLFGARPRIVIFSKTDLADPEAIKHWIDYLTSIHNQLTVALSLKQSRGQNKLLAQALELTSSRRQSRQAKGLLPAPMRACVVGMPNVGKSSFINWLVGKRTTRVANQPGITKGPQWVRIHPQMELLDTPGILPPVALPQEIEIKLALFNLMPENRYDPETLVEAGLKLISKQYPDLLQRYGLHPASWDVMLCEHAANRNLLVAGGALDLRRAATSFLNDLRSGSVGRITLDPIPGSNARERRHPAGS